MPDTANGGFGIFGGGATMFRTIDAYKDDIFAKSTRYFGFYSLVILFYLFDLDSYRDKS